MSPTARMRNASFANAPAPPLPFTRRALTVDSAGERVAKHLSPMERAKAAYRPLRSVDEMVGITKRAVVDLAVAREEYMKGADDE